MMIKEVIITILNTYNMIQYAKNSLGKSLHVHFLMFV